MKKISAQGIPSVAIGIGIGVGIGLAVTTLICAIVAAMVAGEYMQESAMVYGAWASTAIGAMTAAFIGAMKIQMNRILACLTVGAAYFVCLLCITAMFFGGQFQSVGANAILILGVSAAVGLIGNRRKEQSIHRKYTRKVRSIV